MSGLEEFISLDEKNKKPWLAGRGKIKKLITHGI